MPERITQEWIENLLLRYLTSTETLYVGIQEKEILDYTMEKYDCLLSALKSTIKDKEFIGFWCQELRKLAKLVYNKSFNEPDNLTNCHHVLLIDYIKKYHANLDELNELMPRLNRLNSYGYDRFCDTSLDELQELLNKLNEQKQAIGYLSL